MKAPVLNDVVAQLRSALEDDDLTLATHIIEALRSPDQADLFSKLDDDDQLTLLPQLNPADSADILEDLEDAEAAELVSNLPTSTVIRIVDEMEPDEAADLLGDIASEQARQVLAGLEDPDEVRPLLLYADDSAGGLMTSEHLVLRRRMRGRDAIQALREWHPDGDFIYYLAVVDRYRRLCGVVSLQQLIVVQPDTPLAEIMDVDVVSVQVGTDQEECARLMSRYDLLALPVVDETNTLLGIITIDDVVDVLEEEATEDIHRLGGAEPLDRAYLSTSVLTITRKRVGWLLMLFLTATLTGSVMRHFQDEMRAVVALSIFIPLLIGTGGNAGSQTTAMVIRALATDDIGQRDALYVWWHEARIGVILGLGMAVVAYARAVTWESDPRLALTVALSIMGIVLWATMAGSLLPLLAARLRIDPTVVSGPAMSTLVDATGLFIYFTTARFILGL